MTNHEYVSDDRLQTALMYVAHLVLRYGDGLSPIFDRLESELEIRKRTGSAQDRARAALERYTFLTLDHNKGERT